MARKQTFLAAEWSEPCPLLLLSVYVAALTGGYSAASRTSTGRPVERPALVVVVAVDQLGQDLLERYDSLFTGGSPVSHPGHMTLATGASPRAHEATY